MAKIRLLYIFTLLLFANYECEVYQDRPKIKTSDGDLILEPAYDKSIFLRPNGPKSSIFVGEVNILNVQSKPAIAHHQEVSNNDFQDFLSLNGPNGILKRLEKLESKSLPLPEDLFFNISIIWRKLNILQRKVNNLQILINHRAKDVCESQPCQHGGTCLNIVNGYHCLCPNNWEGRDCDMDVNECRNFAGTDLGCQNGATCINKPGSYECLCRSGWFGLHCTRKAKDCSGGDFEMCGHGTCVKVDTGEGITCICQQGWTTNGTGVACLTDINECDSYQGARCSVNPKVDCINLPGSFRCGQCPHGYEGDGYTCSDIDECVTLPNGGCSPTVSCTNTIGSRICGPCPPGYQGDGVTCTWRGSCQINNGECHPSARCVESMSIGRAVQCVCPDGMDGDGVGLHGCYIAAGNNYTRSCESNPCFHGQCHVVSSGYTCICESGYGGRHCDVAANMCVVNPCRNGGTCSQDRMSATGFRCECTAQYTGSLCDLSSRTCGGVLDNEEGTVVYPPTNSTYAHNSKCVWLIRTVETKVINVTFSKFNLEAGGSDCLYDFLQIHDGPTPADLLIGRFCGNTLPKGGNIISNRNHLYFWFRSDGTVAKEGFALHWTSINPVCGGHIDANTNGHIESPGSPGKYPPNRDCFWNLRARFGKKIQLLFFALDIEKHTNCSFDYIAIYDGRLQTDPLLNKYCNSDLPPPLLSAGSEILIHFHSDAYGAGKGFQLAYAPAPGVPGCGGYFTQEQGEISAPTYNGTYLANMLCEYKIQTSPGTKIRIEITQFNLERSVRCRFDYLKIYDGPSESSPLVGKFCGTTYPKSYVSSSNTLYIIFHSDVTISLGGFKMLYKGLCQQTLDGDSGVIKSPGYPFSYPANKVCEYFIVTTPGKAIQLTFQDFDIEDNRYYNCQYDNVEIRDGSDSNSTLLGRYCGGSEHTPPEQISTHNHMYLRFNSDMSISGTGFYANYTTLVTECGGIYRDITGLINHPSSDSTSYKNDQTCTWILVANPGMHIKLTWHRFELEHMPSCDSDYLELIEVDEHNSNYTLGKFCGSKTPPAFTTTTNRLVMKFKSDSSIRSAGFSVSYTFLDDKAHCDGIMYKTHGFIYSPGWPNRYEPNRDCTWVITVPVGQQIRLNISQFDLERPIRGTCNSGDYVELRNGATQNSPLIGQYCGRFQTRIIKSVANSLHIRFHSDSYLTGNGFKMEWDGSAVGCGGTLTSSSGTISSPNYPETYNENTECFYKIVTSFGSRIRLNFVDLELERTTNCRDDYVEIFDGKDFDSKSLGKHCMMNPSLNNIETTSNYAMIKFRSDSYIVAKGFMLNYHTDCNNNLTGTYGVIESLDYPNEYPLNLNCNWNIDVPKGNKINVTFSHFDIFNHFRPPIYSAFAPPGRYYFYNRLGSNSGQCHNDYLQWKEKSDSKYSDTYCGSKAPTISTKTNSLQIKFATGSFGSRTGFRLEWKSYGCGGHIQKPYGSISIDRDIITSEGLECEWLIETDVGRSVSLVISDIFVKESQNCDSDFVKVFNGQDTNSPLLSRKCDRQITTLQSTSNVMLVKFVKTSSLRGAFFTASFTSPKAKCGGYITSLSAYIYSPNYPKNYDSNLDCRWTISVPAYHRIEFNFIELDLYSNDRYDCSDSIKILDGINIVGSNSSEIICPNSKTKQIITKYNNVVFEFKSDKSGNAKGFKVNFTATCGAYISASRDGLISNEFYVGGSNKTCTWYIRAPQPDQKISLTITHLFLPTYVESNSNRSCSSSYLRVYNGDDTDAPLIDEYCGKRSPPMIVSQGSAIAVSLGSYDNQITGHFSAHYSPVSETCGGEYTSEEGSIASPNYPRAYPVAANCEWTLSTSPGNKVYVTFEVFDLEYSEGCNEDYLEIRENNGGGKLLGVYCGSDIPSNTSTANKLYIKFHSNDGNSGKGFLMHYGFLHGNELINMERGEIASPLYPNLYLGASTYTWRIQSEGTETVGITVDNLEIPSYGASCTNYLSIYDGYDDTAPLLSTLCGKLPQALEVIQTSSNMAFIKLSLDESNTGTQFHLTWAKTDVTSYNIVDNSVTCGSNHTILVSPGNFSTFESPHYPNEYDNDLKCEWTFEATSGRHLKLNFNEFEIEETNNCFADSVSVYSADNPGQWKRLEQGLCEQEKTSKLTANSSKYMKVTFKTDSSITRKGFQGKVSSMCGGLITNLSGEIGPTWDDAHVGPFLNHKLKCEWVVKVRPGRMINLEFKHFNISTTDDNCLTSVTVKNGDSIEAPLLSGGKYCGYSHENRNIKFTTSSNSLYVSYANNLDKYNKGVFQTFTIRYEEQNVECGGVLELNEDQNSEIISSPKYPDTPTPYSECIWIVKGPPGEILRVDFIGRFDLDNINNCETEVVELRDGTSNLSPSLGRFCGETPPTIKTKNNALYVKYLTQLLEPRDGFKANISIDICGGTIVAESGEIKSPNYPHMINIPYNTVCEWRIKGPVNHIFTINPQDINLPEPESHCATNIVIQEDIIGTAPNSSNPSKITQVLKDFCDASSDSSAIESSSNEVVIRYYSGKASEFPMTRNINRGFRFTFNSKRPTCGGSITTSEGFITSPGYPSYTLYRYCSWSIIVPDSSRRIKLELLDVDATKHTIGIYNDNTYQSLIQPVSTNGNNLVTRVYESSGNKLSLFLWLNRSVTRHRFKAKFSSEQEALCGGNLQGLNGTLNSVNIDRSYTCEWHYDSRVGLADSDYNTILVTVSLNSSATSQTPGRCRYSDPKLNIKASIPKIYSIFSKDFCGIINNESFRVPHTAIDFKASKSGSHFLSYQLEYKAQPCGGIININESPVDVINIPSSNNDTLDCAWVINSPYNTRIEFKMEGFFQYGCDDEYLKISQGLMFSTPIGIYCKETILSQPLLINFRHIYVEYHTRATNSSKLKLIARTEKDTCGGQLTEYQRVFSSPNYPKSYESNEECSWMITAEEGSRVSLSFVDRFVVESAPNCTKDVVLIYDWNNDKYNEMARICGREILGPYNSTYNKMKVILRTDATTNLDGFRAIWAPICGGNYTATDKNQTLYSPGFTRVYPSMANCNYVITAPNDKKILVKFLEFELEGAFPSCPFDNVTITAENDDNYARFVTINCGTELPSIPSKYNKISILFQSDRFVQKRGFKLLYHTFECGGEVNEPTILTSHLGDGAYDDNMNCSWMIKAPANKLIVFKFIYVDLENNDDCYMDSVSIFEGLLIEDDKRLALLCGHDMNSSIVLKSRGNKALLNFVSDHSNTFTGFKVAISFTYGESVGCGGQIDLTTSSTKTLKSPTIGSNVVYENYLDCHWTIKSPPDTVVQIEFLSFHISPCENVNQTAIGFSNCKCDFVELRDGSNPDSLVIGTYCGHTLPPSLHSSGNVMNVRLSTDGELTSSGFEARLSAQPNACGQTRFTIKEKSTRVKSPGYDSGTIPRGIRCVYHFSGESNYYGSTVHISITNLDMQPPIDENGKKTCNADKLIISSNPNNRNITVGKDYIVSHSVDSFLSSYYYYEIEDDSLPRQIEYCGSLKHSDIYVTGNIAITLISSPESDSNTHKGVEFEVSLVGFCGMNYTGTQGRIQTPSSRMYDDYSDESNNVEDCYTLITAPENRTISVYFISLSPSYWNDNVLLNIYDGKDTSSKKLITVNKDYTLDTMPIFSKGRYLLFHNHAIDDEHVQYELLYTTTDKGQGCGGKLSNVLGRVTSPMYPDIYRQVSHCEWELETPVGTRVRLHFQTFLLGKSCDQNYLELFDSKGNLISSYCEEAPADYTSTDNYIKIVFHTTKNNGGQGWAADFVGIR